MNSNAPKLENEVIKKLIELLEIKTFLLIFEKKKNAILKKQIKKLKHENI